MTAIGDAALAVLPCRGGDLPLGADETVAEAGGDVLLVGDGTERAEPRLSWARRVRLVETPPGLRPGLLCAHLVPLLAGHDLVLLPASPDGRDLAPRLAAALDRPLFAGATRVTVTAGPHGPEVAASLLRLDERVELPVRAPAPVVATLLPGVRSVTAAPGRTVTRLIPSVPADRERPGGPRDGAARGPAALSAGTVATLDVEVLEVLEPDPSTMDLADAPRVVAAGAGLIPPGTPDPQARALFALLSRVARALGASTGATRVLTDAGWVGVERQIGTTGVALDPVLYVAFGISGATQHVGGIGSPDQVVSVNTDPSCPMTAMATLGLVADAPAVLAELGRRLGVDDPGPAPGIDGARVDGARADRARADSAGRLDEVAGVIR